MSDDEGAKVESNINNRVNLGVAPITDYVPYYNILKIKDPLSIDLSRETEDDIINVVADLQIELEKYPDATIITSGRSGLLCEVILDAINKPHTHLGSRFNNIIYKDLDDFENADSRDADWREANLKEILKGFGWVTESGEYNLPTKKFVLVDDFVTTGNKHEIYKAFFKSIGVDLTTISLSANTSSVDMKSSSIPGKVDKVIIKNPNLGFFFSDLSQLMASVVDVFDQRKVGLVLYSDRDSNNEPKRKEIEIGKVRESVTDVLSSLYRLSQGIRTRYSHKPDIEKVRFHLKQTMSRLRRAG